ncbi:MAG: glutamine amidotransferase-related protein [Pseudomonadales bacterium]
MRIGILRTDSVLEGLQTAHGDYPAMFAAVLSNPTVLPEALQGIAPEFAEYAAHEGELPAPDACDAYLITGSRHSVYDPLPWLPPLVEFLRAALAGQRKIIGICFGHQLIAHFFVGETAAAAVGWCIVLQENRVEATASWMTPSVSSFSLPASHRDQVQRLPHGAVRFASTERCPNAGFVVGDQIFALQCHPEFTRAYAEDLLKVREPVLGSERVAAARASLAMPSDAPLVARWILNFVAGKA